MLAGLLGLMAGTFALYNTARLGIKGTRKFYKDVEKTAIYGKKPKDTGYIYDKDSRHFIYKGDKK